MSIKNKNTPHSNNEENINTTKRVIAGAGAALALSAGLGSASELPPEPINANSTMTFEESDAPVEQDLPAPSAITNQPQEKLSLSELDKPDDKEAPEPHDEPKKADATEKVDPETKTDTPDGFESEQVHSPPVESSQDSSDQAELPPVKGGPEDVIIPPKGGPRDLVGTPYEVEQNDAIPRKGGPEDLVGTPYELDAEQENPPTS